jgi:Protein of unknown function (DUF4038)/Putative collagen-binding domain of a collagenase
MASFDRSRVILALVASLLATDSFAQSAPTALRVSENRRHIVSADGRPFFYLGDTAWELFHRLSREEADRYLENRASAGYTVIQAVALAELDGLNDPNPYGHRPLIDQDPTRPDVREGPANDYWDHVDYIVRKANALGLVVGLLPTWGDKWNKKWGVGPEIFTPENARAYGRWLGSRYRDAGLIWIVGGDRPIEADSQRVIVEQMAMGLREGDGGAHLITFHPTGGSGSSLYFHDSTWLDFNMRQNGHVLEFTGRYAMTRADYDRSPTKPVLDGEPIYEDHPVSFNAKERGHSVSADVRRPLYWNLFSGAFGHTYGNHAVWQMWTPGRQPINNPLMPWHEAINQPGARQMQYGRWLIESRPMLSRIPDDGIIVASAIPTNMPGEGVYRFVATRDEEGTYAMVYAPVGRPITVRMDVIKGERVLGWWYNPRNGEATRIGTFDSRGEQTFVPPTPGELLDWVLVLDDAANEYPAPGTRGR